MCKINEDMNALGTQESQPNDIALIICILAITSAVIHSLKHLRWSRNVDLIVTDFS